MTNGHSKDLDFPQFKLMFHSGAACTAPHLALYHLLFNLVVQTETAASADMRRNERQRTSSGAHLLYQIPLKQSPKVCGHHTYLLFFNMATQI